jgi:hypothetical protein
MIFHPLKLEEEVPSKFGNKKGISKSLRIINL